MRGMQKKKTILRKKGKLAETVYEKRYFKGSRRKKMDSQTHPPADAGNGDEAQNRRVMSASDIQHPAKKMRELAHARWSRVSWTAVYGRKFGEKKPGV